MKTMPQRAAKPTARMEFVDEKLVLGAETCLAAFKTGIAGYIDTARLRALLAVAYGRPITDLQLDHTRRAVELMAEGEVTMALVNLALTGLGDLHSLDEAAWRLSAARAP